ncbi:caveolin-2 isoform X1 [Mustela erminea]|uniref:caveolin-2 isoform X1 n=1 Tax=Mustela erminea TaxID=36723 RepID=UPI001387526C|nr:caveolin-2 isoform X1 [Mustela erminea]
MYLNPRLLNLYKHANPSLLKAFECALRSLALLLQSGFTAPTSVGAETAEALTCFLDPQALVGLPGSQVGFEDVIAEPVTTHSFDKVWICSHALFEISKYVIYKFLTFFLAIPMAFAAGILFAILSCLHIWIIMPFVKTCLMVLPSVQTIWKTITDVVIAPLCTSVGRSFSSISLQLSHD